MGGTNLDLTSYYYTNPTSFHSFENKNETQLLVNFENLVWSLLKELLDLGNGRIYNNKLYQLVVKHDVYIVTL